MSQAGRTRYVCRSGKASPVWRQCNTARRHRVSQRWLISTSAAQPARNARCDPVQLAARRYDMIDLTRTKEQMLAEINVSAKVFAKCMHDPADPGFVALDEAYLVVQ